MTVLVDEVYARILTEQSQNSERELSEAVAVMEGNAKNSVAQARRQMPMLGVLRAALAANHGQ
ncbi:hypothetical protein KO498_09205 [Lentibacter algarum]|uniref:hypothetical protein n=1 Tax=Lentibacter algarum TaxID=576131 RepID=UPI001C072DE5|nr:hypothetical protein [Lentibacter algarum]MBU2981990.1 hypothetical protein [Lentibacter algarum]